ncbi:MAG: methyltransferase domain-containing protein [Candidatus Curtissbacteria bacterium]|nr:methyltransferase domain-containing protein [Candidatus Curtissbacteria bacterium]
MRQPQKSKFGEVVFRQKLVDQHLGKNKSFPGQPDQKQILDVLKERVDSSRKIFKNLQKRNLTLSPFLEIGAEKCQRASLLSSGFKSPGFALDISFESLKSAAYFAKKLKLNKLPVLICADAENLPFADNSLPFVFAFETLHHFPDPRKTLEEMKRVTANNGYVFFSEEPVKQTVNLPVWRRDFNLTKYEKILKKLFILPFLSTLGASETRYGILENVFPVSTWQSCLKMFEEIETIYEPVFFGPKSKVGRNNQFINPLTRFLIGLQGGGITALAKIKKPQNPPTVKNVYDLLACPKCRKKLSRNISTFNCKSCKQTYPIKDKVIFLLNPVLRKKLYPNI